MATSRQAYAAAVIVAAGKGERFGDGGKVLAMAADRPLLAWSLDAFANAASIRDIVIVAGEHTEEPIRELVVAEGWPGVSTIVLGGASRHESVARGIAAVDALHEVVLVHDAARPLIEAAHIDAAADAARDRGAAILATPVADTIKRVEGDAILETVPRSSLWAAQTPQAFRLEAYQALLRDLTDGHGDFTDDASIFEAFGKAVAIVPGSRLNLKVTHPEDLDLVDALLRARLHTTLTKGTR